MVLKRSKNNNQVPKIDILGVKIDDISQNLAVQKVLELAKDNKKSHYVVTVNSEFVMLARKNRQFLKILNEADLALADGAGVVFSKLIFGGKVRDRITGVNLIEKICQKSAIRAIRIGFLGGFGNVAAMVAKRQKSTNPNLKVVFAQSGDPSIGYDLRLKRQLLQLGRIDVLFVAYGMGRQEFWIERNKDNLNVGVFIGVGGAFDYLSMVKKRAPKFLQNWGMEWFWRLLMEPTRIWRMRVLPAFLILIFWFWTVKKIKFYKTYK